MKFSATLLKELVPGINNKAQIIEALSLYAFEAEEAPDDTVNISIPPNRFSDVASHWGVARELAAILGSKYPADAKALAGRQVASSKAKESKASYPLPATGYQFSIRIADKKLCSRYAVQYFENIKIAPSPKWMQKILADCGIRPINNAVDIMNYVMLETGQPLHAFDFDKLITNNRRPATIIVRRAKKGEKIRGIDDKMYPLDDQTLVIVDYGRPIAIAGIKGGKETEVDRKTKRILVEAANFEGSGIYKTSRRLGLQTDASIRFSHSISAELAPMGLARAGKLLLEIMKAKPGAMQDVNFTKLRERPIPFSFEKLDTFLGTWIPQDEAEKHLRNLGFEVRKVASLKGRLSATPLTRAMSGEHYIVVPPPLRDDVEAFEDIAEEVARLHGYGAIAPRPPRIHLLPSGFEDQITLKDKVRRILNSFGFDEVYGYSFVSKDEARQFRFNNELVELQNPISEEFEYLRPALASALFKTAQKNTRFFDPARIFEIGKIFYRTDKEIEEKLVLGIAVAATSSDAFFELKGLVREFLKKTGLVDFSLTAPRNNDWVIRFTKDYIQPKTLLKIGSGKDVLGYLGRLSSNFSGKTEINICEIDLGMLLRLVSAEHEYRPLPRYPAVMRDLSLVLPEAARVGEIMQAIQDVDRTLIEDVDIIDEYILHPQESVLDQRGSAVIAMTFRVVFQAEDRTLTDKEVNQKMKKIEASLIRGFAVKVR